MSITVTYRNNPSCFSISDSYGSNIPCVISTIICIPPSWVNLMAFDCKLRRTYYILETSDLIIGLNNSLSSSFNSEREFKL